MEEDAAPLSKPGYRAAVQLLKTGDAAPAFAPATVSAGTLYVVATPIGNLSDVSARARKILGEVDLVICEDTRVTGKLLSRLELRKPCRSYREENEQALAPTLVAELHSGKSMALVSDAGTPTLSDPGFRLVRACRNAGVPVIPVPGPFAAAAALAASGLPTDGFLFAGFLPQKRPPACASSNNTVSSPIPSSATSLPTAS